MAQRIRSLLGAGILGVALALSLEGCGSPASAPVDDPALQEGSASEAETPEDPPAPDAREASDPLEGLDVHENDYLTIGLADGWTVNSDYNENRHFEYENGSGYNLTVQYDDSSIGRRGFYVAVYDEPTYGWAPDFSDGSLPDESESQSSITALDPIAIDGVEFCGYRSQIKGSDGSLYWYGFYCGTVNGHYVEIFFTDGSEGNELLEDQMCMARSLRIK